ncbi:MAG: FmdB family zinc ribbon protein [Bacillota bacterium]|jgi:putative FmdB family regulatory protein
MPTYTFDCPNCGRFDISLRMSSPNLDECPTCQSPVKKVFLPQRAIFRGGLPSNSYERRYSFLNMDKLASGKVTPQEMMEEYKIKRWGEKATPEQILGDFKRELDEQDHRIKNLETV